MQYELFETEHSIKSGDTQVCNKCNLELPLTCFNKKSMGYYRKQCKICSRKLQRELDEIRKTTPPPPEDHVCPICLRNSEEVRGLGGSNTGSWALDHNHKTGKARGWLCFSCNLNIGNFKDDTERLKRAVEYLERNK